MTRTLWHWAVWGAAVGIVSLLLVDDLGQRLGFGVIVMVVTAACVLIWRGLSLPPHNRGGDHGAP